MTQRKAPRAHAQHTRSRPRVTRSNPSIGEWFRGLFRRQPSLSTPMEVQPLNVGYWVANNLGDIGVIVAMGRGTADMWGVASNSVFRYDLHELRPIPMPLQPGQRIDISGKRYVVTRVQSNLHRVVVADASGREQEIYVKNLKLPR